MKYCPDCGKQTFDPTGDTDYEAGDEYVCLSCGYSVYISESERREFTAENGAVEKYDPVHPAWYSVLASFTQAGCMSVLSRAYSQVDIEENLSTCKGEHIKFRRYGSLLGEGV